MVPKKVWCIHTEECYATIRKMRKIHIHTDMERFLKIYSSFALLRYNCHCLGLRCAIYWSDTFINCKMITIITLANTSILSHNYNCFTVVRIIKIYSLQYPRHFDMLHFHFHLFWDISWFTLISSLTHSLFRNMFNFHIFVNFPVSSCYWFLASYHCGQKRYSWFQSS